MIECNHDGSTRFLPECSCWHQKSKQCKQQSIASHFVTNRKKATWMQGYSPRYPLRRCNPCAFKRGGMRSSSVNAILLHLGPQIVHLVDQRWRKDWNCETQNLGSTSLTHQCIGNTVFSYITELSSKTRWWTLVAMEGAGLMRFMPWTSWDYFLLGFSWFLVSRPCQQTSITAIWTAEFICSSSAFVTDSRLYVSFMHRSGTWGT